MHVIAAILLWGSEARQPPPGELRRTAGGRQDVTAALQGQERLVPAARTHGAFLPARAPGRSGRSHRGACSGPAAAAWIPPAWPRPQRRGAAPRRARHSFGYEAGLLSATRVGVISSASPGQRRAESGRLVPCRSAAVNEDYPHEIRVFRVRSSETEAAWGIICKQGFLSLAETFKQGLSLSYQRSIK